MRKKKIKLDSRTRQSIAFTKLRRVRARVHVLSCSSGSQQLREVVRSLTSLCFSFLTCGMETRAASGRIIEGPELH